MGRSIETIGDKIVYFKCDDIANEEGDWQDLIINLQTELHHKYPSMEANLKDKWVGYPYNENRIVIENYLVQVSITENCAFGAVSVFVHRDLYYTIPENLAEHWLEQCWPEIKKIVSRIVPNKLNKLGTMNNGVSFYEKAR